jgi:hypothetical protein
MRVYVRSPCGLFSPSRLPEELTALCTKSRGSLVYYPLLQIYEQVSEILKEKIQEHLVANDVDPALLSKLDAKQALVVSDFPNLSAVMAVLERDSTVVKDFLLVGQRVVQERDVVVYSCSFSKAFSLFLTHSLTHSLCECMYVCACVCECMCVCVCECMCVCVCVFCCARFVYVPVVGEANSIVSRQPSESGVFFQDVLSFSRAGIQRIVQVPKTAGQDGCLEVGGLLPQPLLQLHVCC